MDLLRAALREDSAVALDIAALEMAAIESHGLAPEPHQQVLDRIASEIMTRLGPAADGPKFIRVTNNYLFGELGFLGNEAEYHDPRNSCLNEVLERRTGLPITLSVVYIEVARRLGRPVFGIGLPGHFVVEYNDGLYATYLDPFHGGELLTKEDCRALAQEITGVDIAVDSALQPVSNRYILVRMLNNLRSAYFQSKQFRKMVQVLDLLIEAFPSEGDYYKARGAAHLHLNALTAGKHDLTMYLKFSPQAEDRAEIKKQLEAIHRWLGRVN